MESRELFEVEAFFAFICLTESHQEWWNFPVFVFNTYVSLVPLKSGWYVTPGILRSVELE